MEVNETLSSSFELEARGSLRLDSPAPELEPSVAVLVKASKTWNQTKQTALKREGSTSLAYSFSSQKLSSGSSDEDAGEHEELEEKFNLLDGWTRRRQHEINPGRASFNQRDPIKTVEINTSRSYSYSSTPNSNSIIKRSDQYNYQSHHLQYNYQQQRAPPQSYPVASPQSPVTPTSSTAFVGKSRKGNRERECYLHSAK
ncbi:hypothetical protein ACFXTH_031529 [Malus domestica]